MSLLDRDGTPEDRAAAADAPRPGIWTGEDAADRRALTQDQTDMLIRFELYRRADRDERDAIVSAVGGQPGLVFLEDAGRVTRAQCQRGGIDSDPLVRILARRAWGDRDQQWFAHHGVRAGDAVAADDTGCVACAWPDDPFRWGIALDDAGPGDLVHVRADDDHRVVHKRVGERPRTPPATHATADAPPTNPTHHPSAVVAAATAVTWEDASPGTAPAMPDDRPELTTTLVTRGGARRQVTTRFAPQLRWVERELADTVTARWPEGRLRVMPRSAQAVAIVLPPDTAGPLEGHWVWDEDHPTTRICTIFVEDIRAFERRFLEEDDPER